MSLQYFLVLIPVALLLALHWWLARRQAVWLGAIVPVVATTAFVVALLVAQNRGVRDFLAPVAGLAVLLWMWAEGITARRRTAATATEQSSA